MKKTKRRYFSKEDILKEIDKYRAKALRHREAADAYERNARYLMANDMVADAKTAMQAADRSRSAAARIIDKKLPKLKQKLSEFMTPKLPVIDDGDPSIQA